MNDKRKAPNILQGWQPPKQEPPIDPATVVRPQGKAKVMGDTRPDHAKIAAQVFTLGARERQRLIEPTIAFYESVNELRDDQDMLLVTLHQYHQALGLLAAAEQRATESDARAERLAAALRDYRERIANITSGWGDQLPRDVTYSLSTSHYSVAALLDDALTAPATQPAERAAAERAVSDALREWQKAWGTVQWARLRAEVVTPQMEDAVYQASCELHDILATDGAAKEGA